MMNFELSENFVYTGYYNGKYVHRYKLKHEKVLDCIAARQLIKYELDDDGKLLVVETAYDHTKDGTQYDGLDENKFSLEYEGMGCIYNKYVSTNYSCDPKATKVFFVSSTGVSEEDFLCSSYNAKGPAVQNVDVKVYDANSAMVASAVVITDLTTEFTANADFYGVAPALVIDKKTTLNDEGEEQTVISVIMDRAFYDLVAAKEGLAPVTIGTFKDLAGNVTRTNMRVDKFENLKVGDVICYSVDLVGKVSNFVVLNEYDETHQKSLFEYEIPYSNMPSYSLSQCYSGKVIKSVLGKNIRLDCYEDRILRHVSATDYYVIDANRKNLIYQGRTAPTISEGDYAFVWSRRLDTQCVVVYK